MNSFNAAARSELTVILLAEDDEDDIFLFKETLENIKDIEIKVVANGLEALSSLDKLPEADIIFLDVNMPLMDGIECLIEIRNVHIGVPVIILTTSSSEVLINQAKTLGASGFICKPSSVKRYKAIMKEVLSLNWKSRNTPFYSQC